tara:strand:- start:275 stop:475 length:201 start_codon:yes stop_codon:yes gene_type:complete
MARILSHDLDRPLADLKEIKKSLPENIVFKPTQDLIDMKISEYQEDIEAVEKYNDVSSPAGELTDF